VQGVHHLTIKHTRHDTATTTNLAAGQGSMVVMSPMSPHPFSACHLHGVSVNNLGLCCLLD